MLCKLRAANLYPCVFFVRPHALLLQTIVCADLHGATPQKLCAPLCGMHVCLLDVISMRLWDLFFDSVVGGAEKEEKIAESGKQTITRGDEKYAMYAVCQIRPLSIRSRQITPYCAYEASVTSQLTFASPTQASMRPYLNPTCYDIMPQVNRHCRNLCTGLQRQKQKAVDSSIPLQPPFLIFSHFLL